MNVKIIALTGAEQAVSIGGSHAEVKNNGTDTIYASANSGIVAGADGVVSIPAGAPVTVLDTRGTVYLLGTGSVEVVGKDFVSQVFKPAATSGGGGTEDEVARNAINAHAGNAEIHVTAEEKAAWNGKAELVDIPTSLPANGGNADTVGGKYADDFVLSNNPTIKGDIRITRDNSTMDTSLFAWEDTVRLRNEDANAEKSTYTDLIIKKDSIYMVIVQNGEIISDTKINDGGNAASVGAYTEEKIAALEARIAALEGK